MEEFSTAGQAELKEDEGFRNKPYRCTAGFLTIGWGHNLDAHGIQEKFLQMIFEDDIAVKITEMETHAALAWIFDDCRVNQVRKDAFVNLAFNLGCDGLAKFKKTLAAGRRDDWETCANELIDSSWYRQVGRRGPRIVGQVRSGERS